jgi:hypothetical protein
VYTIRRQTDRVHRDRHTPSRRGPGHEEAAPVPASRARGRAGQRVVMREERPPPALLDGARGRQTPGVALPARRLLIHAGRPLAVLVRRAGRRRGRARHASVRGQGRHPAQLHPRRPPHRASGADGARARVLDVRPPTATGDSAGYATLAETPFPIVTAQARKKVALIGARGYTGRRSPRSSGAHPTRHLSHGSSLAGFSLDESTMAHVAYGNLSLTNVQRMEAEGAVDACALALPNGAEALFVAALDAGAKPRGDGGSIAVDLSADYRFDESGWWAYGLPGKLTVNAFRKSSSHVHLTMYRTVRPRHAAHRKTHLEPGLLRHGGADAAGAATSPHRAGQHADRLRRVRPGTATGRNDEAGRPTTLAKATAKGQAERAELDGPG